MEIQIKGKLFDEQQIRDRVKELAEEIEKDANGTPIVIVAVLKGSMVFAADLMRYMKGSVQLDTVATSSYGKKTVSSGSVQLRKDLDLDVEGKYVVIIEDIIDTGQTLKFLCKHMELHQPKQLKICTLLDKPARRLVQLDADYVGFEIPDEFVIGYGIDYAEQYRNLPYIGYVETT
ncbi:MAG: hypoxanthine phosphoribosyltransferase [Exiguobacterium marinum]|uniref:Hypoxanthine phosphoribosyltransferase n=1 Tax=Exiguobacterium marinum TaxID=273528 RepID=A0ABY7WVD6_9BACL|nr:MULTISPECIES: hypoxanthine phosphoribosyltransferase [Exiguobacterium]WDH74843.1 hypoxanthine phosphoribosyltransferase [Exiguobacterium marinum]